MVNRIDSVDVCATERNVCNLKRYTVIAGKYSSRGEESCRDYERKVLDVNRHCV